MKARDLGLSECQKCGDCCRQSPCNILPGEVDAIASYLQLSREEFLKNYIAEALPGLVDYFLRNGFCLPLRRAEYGDCILLDQETRLCRVWPVRPQAARDFCCWEK